MKKEYIFVVLIFIMLYMVYLVLSYKYTEYKINSNIQYLSDLKQEFSEKIEEAEDVIEYTNTKAYKNKILKQHQSKKNKGEQVVNLISEQRYEKYTRNQEIGITRIEAPLTNEQTLISTMTIYQRWNYFLFGTDTR